MSNPLNNKQVFAKDISGRDYHYHCMALDIALQNVNDKELIHWLKSAGAGDVYHDLSGYKLTIIN
jgi:hypothetical protein